MRNRAVLRFSGARALWSASLLGVSFVLGACTPGSSPRTGGEGKAAWGPEAAYPRGSDGDEIVLYKWSSRHLVRYSTSGRRVTFETRQPQTFQYGFSTRSGLYTSGDSLEYGFRLLETDGREVRTVVRAEGARGLFPVARTAAQTIVSVIDYDAAGRIRGSRLARVTGGKLEIVAELAVSPLGGAIVADRLYFTAAVAGETNQYDLMAVDLGSSTVTRVRSGVRQSQIYAASGGLIVDGRLEGRDWSFPCQDGCATEDRGTWLVALHPDQNGDLTLEVFSLASGRAVWSTVGDIVDYRFDADTLTVYLNGKMITQRLGDLN